MINNTIIGSVTEYFKNIVEEYMAAAIFGLETIGILNGLCNEKCSDYCHKLLPYTIEYLEKLIKPQKK